jgi:hypothetical protein
MEHSLPLSLNCSTWNFPLRISREEPFKGVLKVSEGGIGLFVCMVRREFGYAPPRKGGVAKCRQLANACIMLMQVSCVYTSTTGVGLKS